MAPPRRATRRGPPVMRRFIPVIAAAALLVGALGATEAMASDVVLSVDGQQSTVRTLAPTVGQVLAEKDVTVGEHDTVLPSLASKVTGGSEISVRYGRPITVTIDGATKPVTATGAVADALNAAGVTLGTHDEVTPDLSAALTDDLAITIVGVEIRTVVKPVAVPYTTTTQNDACLL